MSGKFFNHSLRMPQSGPDDIHWCDARNDIITRTWVRNNRTEVYDFRRPALVSHRVNGPGDSVPPKKLAFLTFSSKTHFPRPPANVMTYFFFRLFIIESLGINWFFRNIYLLWFKNKLRLQAVINVGYNRQLTGVPVMV